MKQLLIATAALSLIGGAALAQTTASTPGAYASPGSTQGAQAGVDKTTGTDDANGQAATQGGTSTATPAPAPMATPDAPAPATPPTDSSSMGSSSTQAANTPSGAPPESYPVWTSKHEDRCVNRSQATRTALNGTRTRHMKTTTTTTSTDQPASASPGQ